jgi:hypothetical protein
MSKTQTEEVKIELGAHYGALFRVHGLVRSKCA